MTEAKQLAPGPELDARVAKNMGWTKDIDKDTGNWFWLDETGHTACNFDICLNHTPAFSTDITAAMPLAIKYKLSLISAYEGKWLCGYYDLDTEYLDDDMGVIDGHFNSGSFSIGDTPAHAICLTFLKLTKELGKE